MFLLFKTLMFSINLGILAYLSIVLKRHYQASYSMHSWSAIFHILCICWLALRLTFWAYTLLSTSQWYTVTFHLLYWLPNSFEFGAFACLPVFYVQLIQTSDWQYGTVLKPVYISIIAGLCILQIFWAFLAGTHDGADCQFLSAGVDAVASNDNFTHRHLTAVAAADIVGTAHLATLDAHNSMPGGLLPTVSPAIGQPYLSWSRTPAPTFSVSAFQATLRFMGADAEAAGVGPVGSQVPIPGSCYKTEYTGIAPRVIVGLMFLSLALVQGLYGYYLAHMPAMQFRQYFRMPAEILTKINTFLCVSFCTRGLYVLGTLLGMHALPAIPLQVDNDVNWKVAMCFMLWEYIPTLLLVFSLTQPFGESDRAEQSAPSGRQHEYSDLEMVYGDGDEEGGGGGGAGAGGGDAVDKAEGGIQSRARCSSLKRAKREAGWGMSSWMECITPAFLRSPEVGLEGRGGAGRVSRERTGSNLVGAAEGQVDTDGGKGRGAGYRVGSTYGSTGHRSSGAGAAGTASAAAAAAGAASAGGKYHPMLGAAGTSESGSSVGGGCKASDVHRDGERIHAGSLERFSTPASLEPQASWLSSFPAAAAAAAASSSTTTYATSNMNMNIPHPNRPRGLSINTSGQMLDEGQALLALGVTPPAHMAGAMFGRDGSNNSATSVGYGHVGVNGYGMASSNNSDQVASSDGDGGGSSYLATCTTSEALQHTQTDRQNLTIDRQIRRLRGNSIEVMHGPARLRGNSFTASTGSAGTTLASSTSPTKDYSSGAHGSAIGGSGSGKSSRKKEGIVKK